MRGSGVDSLVESINRLGYVFSSRLAVCSPQQGSNKYELIDGAHRWAAINQLANSENEGIRQRFTDFKFECDVFPYLKRSQQMSIAYSNYHYNIQI